MIRLLLLVLVSYSFATAADPLRILCGQPGVDFPPFYTWIAGDDAPTGRDAELAHVLAAQLERPIEFVQLDLAAYLRFAEERKGDDPEADLRVWALRRGDADLAISCFTITPARATVVGFSRPYAIDGMGVMCARTGRVRELADLREAFSWVVPNTTAAVWAAAELPPEAVVTEWPGRPRQAPADLVASGTVDAIINSAQWLDTLVAEHPGLHVLPDLIAEERLGVGLPIDRPELRAAVDAALDALELGGQLQRIYGRYAVRNAR